jgi:hypothetical protein
VREHRSFVTFFCLRPAERRRAAGLGSGCGKLHFHLDISFVSNGLRAETFLCLFIFLLLFFWSFPSFDFLSLRGQGWSERCRQGTSGMPGGEGCGSVGGRSVSLEVRDRLRRGK